MNLAIAHKKLRSRSQPDLQKQGSINVRAKKVRTVSRQKTLSSEVIKMIRKAEHKQSEALQSEEFQDKIRSIPEIFIEIKAEANSISDLSQEDTATQKQKKSGRSRLRWLIYGSLGFGLLSMAITSLPSLLSCGYMGISAEGRAYVDSMNRGQQAFWTENGTFGSSIAALNIGMTENNNNDKYELQSSEFVTYQYAIPKNEKGKSFVGAVFVAPKKAQISQGSSQRVNSTSNAKPITKKELNTVTILCEAPKNSFQAKLPQPFLKDGIPTCAEGSISYS